MTIRPEAVQEFADFVVNMAPITRSFDGCTHLDVLQDVHHPNVMMSYSHWVTEQHLNSYRNSEFFRNRWAIMKQYFEAPAQAWSMQKVQVQE